MSEDRRVVTAPMLFTAADSETDRWQPGEQFIVLDTPGEVTRRVQRGNRYGWISAKDLDECSRPKQPGDVVKGRGGGTRTKPDDEQLQQAIDHAQGVADSYKDTVPDCDCAREHRQLAAWLRELQERRIR